MSDATTADEAAPRSSDDAGGHMQQPMRRNVDLLPSRAEIEAAGGTPSRAPETTLYRPDPAPDAAAASDAAAAADDAADARGSATDTGFDVIRPALYLVALLSALITLTPFIDRSGKAIISTLDVGTRINQIFFPALLVVVVFAVGLDTVRALGSLLRWPYLAFAAWLIPAAVLSLDPLLSGRRTIFFLIQVLIACLAVLLPRSERQLAGLLAIAAATVLLLSYGGVLMLPQLSIHQPTDAIEVELAGDWRGVFRHKNEAGAVMAMMVFVGLYVMRARNALLGAAIAMAAALFIVMSGSKSSLILLPLVLALAWLVERGRRVGALAAVGLLVAFNVATLGSSFPGPIRTVLSRAMPDVTFTGRTDLWRFAIEHVVKRPLTGYGIGAFWRTETLMYKDREEAEPEDISGWVAELGTDSHNGYLDVAVSTGLPGLVFLVLSLVLLPLGDIRRALAQPEQRPLARFYIRCWLFGLYLSSVETLLSPLNPVWFLTLQALFGLVLLGTYRLRAPATVADAAPATRQTA